MSAEILRALEQLRIQTPIRFEPADVDAARDWRRTQKIPTTVVRISCDTESKMRGNVNRW